MLAVMLKEPRMFLLNNYIQDTQEVSYLGRRACIVSYMYELSIFLMKKVYSNKYDIR